MGESLLYPHSFLSSLRQSQHHSLGQHKSLPFCRFSCTPSLQPSHCRLSGCRLPHAGWRWSDEDDDISSGADDSGSFEHGVALFNRGEYYQCHDVMESIWMRSPEPKRTVLHAILQCAVGIYHLLNKNHHGAMTEIGESLAKLRKQRFTAGPFLDFEQDVSALLEYIYNTQLEYAACAEDMCITMDGSKESYRLLGNFAAGLDLYYINKAEDGDFYIIFKGPFSSQHRSDTATTAQANVKVPILNTTADDFHRL